MGEDPVETAVGRDQLGRRLLADPGYAGQVVAGVATQRGVLRVLRRRDAGALEDPGLVVQRVIADAATVVEHLDVRVADELVGVAIAGDDDDVVAPRVGLLGGRGDEVVGLEPGELAHRHPEGVEHLTDEAHLLAQRVGRRLALRLVGRVGLVAERRLGSVEGDEHLVGALLLHHVDEHRREPEHGVGQLATGRRHVLGQGEEGAVGQRVAVEQQQFRHGRREPSMTRSATARIFERSLIAVRWMKAKASCSVILRSSIKIPFARSIALRASSCSPRASISPVSERNSRKRPIATSIAGRGRPSGTA